MLRFRLGAQVSANCKADSCLASDMDEQNARLITEFEELYKAKSPCDQLQTGVLQVVDTDPLIEEAPSSFDEDRRTVARLGDGKAAGACIISTKLSS